MEFEWDALKSDSNKIKHDIDFQEATKLWDDNESIRIEASTGNELRYLFIGKIGSKIWSCVVTYRGDKMRIISARRARKKECELYEQNIG